MKHRNMISNKPFWVLFGLLFLSQVLSAAIRLPRLFSDGMVLQRGMEVPVWGWSEPEQQINVCLLSSERKAKKEPVIYTAIADSTGKWQLRLPAMRASGPFTLQVSGGEVTVDINDVWVGDVWLCSGQSNIDVNIERVYPQYPDEIDQDSMSRVRLFKVENEAALTAPHSFLISSGWKTLSKQNAWRFSAIGYFLGKQMAAETGVVQGVIQCSWGGTPIESWIPRDSVARFDPRMADEALYYADAELMEAAKEANKVAADRWNWLLNELDPGIVGNWTAADYDDSQWKRAQQQHLPTGHLTGSYWVRQHIQIDAAHAGQEALLLLGTLVDADFSYVNGTLVGQTGYQYPPRRYNIPKGLLREGDNVITVRFVNHGAAPKFIEDKPYLIRWADGNVQALSDEWLVRPGITMPRQPSMPTAFQNMAAATYNGMLRPLTPYAVAGVVWYQGESNTGRAKIYEAQLRCLMQEWRQQFQQPALPFVIVQLANFMAPTPKPQETGWAELRESQRRAALSDPHAELAVAIDLGEANDIHPLRKKELAERVVLGFEKLVFGKRVMLSPQPLSAKVAGDNTIVVAFDQPVTATHGFELGDAKGHFRNVGCEAKGNIVTLYGMGTRLRYAWKNNPIEADCRAKDTQLPASPFEMTVVQIPE